MAMEEVYKDYGRFKKRSKELQKWVCEEFAEDKQYEKICNLIYHIDEVEESESEIIL